MLSQSRITFSPHNWNVILSHRWLWSLVQKGIDRENYFITLQTALCLLQAHYLHVSINDWYSWRCCLQFRKLINISSEIFLWGQKFFSLTTRIGNDHSGFYVLRNILASNFHCPVEQQNLLLWGLLLHTNKKIII